MYDRILMGPYGQNSTETVIVLRKQVRKYGRLSGLGMAVPR